MTRQTYRLYCVDQTDELRAVATTMQDVHELVEAIPGLRANFQSATGIRPRTTILAVIPGGRNSQHGATNHEVLPEDPPPGVG